MTNLDIDIENPECSVCNKTIKKRKLFLPVRNEKYMSKEDACLCEDCFWRLPAGLHREIISNADQQLGMELNTAVVEGLKKVHVRVSLDEHYVILSKSYNVHAFERFTDKKVMAEKIRSYKKNNVEVIRVFEFGKNIPQTA